MRITAAFGRRHFEKTPHNNTTSHNIQLLVTRMWHMAARCARYFLSFATKPFFIMFGVKDGWMSSYGGSRSRTLLRRQNLFRCFSLLCQHHNLFCIHFENNHPIYGSFLLNTMLWDKGIRLAGVKDLDALRHLTGLARLAIVFYGSQVQRVSGLYMFPVWAVFYNCFKTCNTICIIFHIIDVYNYIIYVYM